jgi:hypothetical protein
VLIGQNPRAISRLFSQICGIPHFVRDDGLR